MRPSWLARLSSPVIIRSSTSSAANRPPSGGVPGVLPMPDTSGVRFQRNWSGRFVPGFTVQFDVVPISVVSA